MVEKNEITANRPIYRILPSQYSEFASADYLTDSAPLVEYPEQIYNAWYASLQAFLNFDGDLTIFTDDQLLALAPYFGFTEEFSPESFSYETKIKLYDGVFKEPYIWRFRGSENVFNYVVNAFNLQALISRPQAFIVGISKTGDVIGAYARGNYKIIVPESYSEDSKELGQIQYIARYWLPFWIKIVEFENNNIPFMIPD